ncbi:MAG: bifunctional helix-turn-helix transcriptional regulator/GNAT family N-acetyltransferase [Dehalococcoidia bacterium]|nr:bifunctional helix-turn-helix transcriptional regulator/GNAT family N-acetyltransferase [Dehalococcoidia bacterium]
MDQSSSTSSEAVSAVRRFSRFYTRRLGLLNRRLLSSEFPLTEVRILYELAHRNGLTATDLVRELDLDAGYLSRILTKFERRGFVSRETSGRDARRALLTLTAAGRKAFEPLDRASREQVDSLLSPLTPDQVGALVRSMQTIEQLLAAPAPERAPYVLRPHRIGDIGWVARRQGMLYAQEYGWNEEFEAFVAEIGAHFIMHFDPQWERCWIAERDGAIAGSIFLVRESDDTAKLRMLYVEPSARGLGIGSRLVDECIRFGREKGYRKLTLWTNDVLVSARRIYEAAGFKLVKEEQHHSFGKDLVGQNWELTL